MLELTKNKVIGNDMDFLFNVLIWVGVVIFAIFIIGFMAAAKLNKKQDNKNK